MGKACIQEWCRGKAWDQEHLTQPKAIHLANSTKGKGKVVHHKDNHQPKSVSHYITHQAMHMARHYQTSHHLAMDFAHQWAATTAANRISDSEPRPRPPANPAKAQPCGQRQGCPPTISAFQRPTTLAEARWCQSSIPCTIAWTCRKVDTRHHGKGGPPAGLHQYLNNGKVSSRARGPRWSPTQQCQPLHHPPGNAHGQALPNQPPLGHGLCTSVGQQPKQPTEVSDSEPRPRPTSQPSKGTTMWAKAR